MPESEMRRAITNILDAEKAAQEIVSKAEAEAQDFLSKAAEQARRESDAAGRQAVAESQKMLQKYEADAQIRRAERIDKEMQADALVVERSKQKAPDAVRLIVSKVALT
jgi:vacuolar-type H+-ATPase subunit H